jgi:hypothetical protein
VEPRTTEQGASSIDSRPWWKSLFWEKLEEIPLRKSRTAG